MVCRIDSNEASDCSPAQMEKKRQEDLEVKMDELHKRVLDLEGHPRRMDDLEKHLIERMRSLRTQMVRRIAAE